MGNGKIVVLTGGVGGAKLVLGLSRVCAPQSVVAIVNTGDDFSHLGLAVSPDIDTLLYTLSGRANSALGWGRSDETWSFMNAVRSLGGPDWFQLGDGDLALHVIRSARLRAGDKLSRITRDFAKAWRVDVELIPATDDAVATMIISNEGVLSFQDYFVRRRCEPMVASIYFEGAQAAKPTDGVLAAIGGTDTEAILIAPSNPLLSISPILAIPGLKEALIAAAVPTVAISPLIDGQAVKGPAAKIMRELGLAVNARSVAEHYSPWLDAMLLDERDAIDSFPIPYAQSDTLMNSIHDRERVAHAALALCQRVRMGSGGAARPTRQRQLPGDSRQK